MKARKGEGPSETQRTALPELHELALENAHEAIAVGQDGRIISCNAKTEEITGYSRAELYAMPFGALIHPEDRALALERNRQREAGGSIPTYTFRALRKDGGVRFVEVKGVTIDWQGRPGTLTFFSDVTEREAARQALLESERFKERVADATPGILYIYDLEERRNVYVNREVTAALGYDATDFQAIGETFLTDLAHPDDLSRLGELFERWQTAQDHEVLTMEYRIRDKAGEWHWFLARDTVFQRKPDGRVKQIVGTAQDITEYKQAQEALRQAQKMEGLGVLAGGMAHDFNNLLVAILGNADLAARDLPPGSSARARVEQIAVAATRASELTNQMLAYAGKGRFVVQQVDLSALLGEIAQLLETSVAKRATLRYELEDGLPAVEGDASQIRQVAMNLITNAAEAIERRPGTITVSTGQVRATSDRLEAAHLGQSLPEGRYVFLEVKDTGVGMDAATRSRIFDPFFTTKFTGRGLGLAATLGIVRGHRGAIELQSAPGEGTTFRVLLPAAQKAAETPSPAPASLDDWRGSGRVLVVDDEPSVVDVLRAMLEEMGFEVVTTRDSRSGLAAFRERPEVFALVIVDLMMPELGGEEVVKQILGLRPGMPVLLSSGYAEADATERFDRTGLAGFVQKPYRYAVLAEAVRDALARGHR